MKNKVSRVGALACALMLLLSMMFALPVSAGGSDPYVLIDGDAQAGWGMWWKAIENSLNSVVYGINADDWRGDVTVPAYMQQTKNIYTGGFSDGGGGGGGGVRGYDYTVNSSTGTTTGTATAYNTGTTTKTSIINKKTVNNSTSYYFNMPTTTYNTTTNNYYETYNIKNIYYNNTYNTYHIQTTNNYNYYYTYSPTFVNITYLDSGTNKFVSNLYFYQLPDGRNSWDLTADEVFGMYFMYDAVNYDLVVEDESTQALYHFDGNMKDESANRGTATYSQGASFNFVDHGNFDSALYWDGQNHQLNFSGIEGGNNNTYEFMLYLTEPGSVASSDFGLPPVFGPDAMLVTNRFLRSATGVERSETEVADRAFRQSGGFDSAGPAACRQARCAA